jgi:hypothetical protein
MAIEKHECVHHKQYESCFTYEWRETAGQHTDPRPPYNTKLFIVLIVKFLF